MLAAELRSKVTVADWGASGAAEVGEREMLLILPQKEKKSRSSWGVVAAEMFETWTVVVSTGMVVVVGFSPSDVCTNKDGRLMYR